MQGKCFNMEHDSQSKLEDGNKLITLDISFNISKVDPELIAKTLINLKNLNIYEISVHRPFI